MKNTTQIARRTSSIPPPMGSPGHAANRLTPQQFERFLKWLNEIRLPDGPGGRKLSQKTIGERTGVAQTFVHNLLTRKVPTTVGTARLMLLNAGVDPRSVLGTDTALGRFEGGDTMTARGQVLDALSAFYDDDFLQTVQKLTPPEGSERWTHHRWNHYVVDLRDLWDSGELKPKRGPPRKK